MVEEFIKIGVYNFKKPEWWDNINVNIPENLKTDNDVRGFAEEKYNSDVGTKNNWREALKFHALAAQKLNYFPLYIAFCYRTGKEYNLAIQVFTELYELAETQAENKEWFKTYIPFNLGRIYNTINDNENAKIWYTKASKFIKNKDTSIVSYAKRALEELEYLK